MSTIQMIPLQDWSKQRFFLEVENKNEELGEKGALSNHDFNFTKEAIIEEKIVMDVILYNILKTWLQLFHLVLKNKSLEDLVW